MEFEKALVNACKNNQMSVIRLLTKKKVNLNYRDDWGKTPLVYVSLKGNLDAVKHLINAGADADATDDFQNTALHHAVVSKNTELAKYFCSLGSIDINTRNKDGNTALLVATELFDRNMVEVLTKAGAKDLANFKNDTAMSIASKNGASAIVELLLLAGDDSYEESTPDDSQDDDDSEVDSTDE